MSELSPRAQARKDKYLECRSGGRWSYSPRDTQRERLYRWERRERRTSGGLFHGDPRMTSEEVENLVAKVYRRLGFPRSPRIRFVGEGRRWAKGGPMGLVLPPWACCMHVVLHELTHSLLPAYCPSHGPEFVRAFMDLLYRFMHVKTGPLRRSLRASKIKIAQDDTTWEFIHDGH